MARAISVSRHAALPSGPPRGARERVARWIQRELARNPPRAKSLVVTVWGDAIAPHGGAVWLGGLIRLLAPLGLNERLVRTSVYRLTQDGWLEARQNGRRSLYRLTTAGRQRFDHASRRIYAPPAADWQGRWEIVLASAPSLAPAQRRSVRQDLGWEGFGHVAPGVFIRPMHGHGAADLRSVLADAGIERRVVVLQAREATDIEAASLRAQAQRCWDLPRVAAEYRAFCERFGLLLSALRGRSEADPTQAFVVRSLLIHAFRRVTLHDPRLPAELLPRRWPGLAAYTLCRDLYGLTLAAAERHLSATLRSDDERLPAAARYLHRRFGGV
jgi:phenylacetic acid degradation operon negative regulatory protein